MGIRLPEGDPFTRLPSDTIKNFEVELMYNIMLYCELYLMQNLSEKRYETQRDIWW